MFEGIDAHINSVFHSIKDFFVPTRNCHVISNISANCGADFCHSLIAFFMDPSSPGRQKSATIVVRPWLQTMYRFQSFCSGGPHKGHFKMGVRVNTARNDISALCVDIFVPVQVLTDLFDDFIFNQDIGFQVRSAVQTIPPFITFLICVLL